MDLLTSEIAQATGGTLSGPDVTVSGVSIDSRTVRQGELFVPVVAERDGHEFIPKALASGAAAYLTSAPAGGPSAGPHDATAVAVADTTAALADLGRHARTRLPHTVVGVTGSVGKTSVKDLLAAVLSVRWPTHANLRSFNNELGVPLTLLNAPPGTGAVVVEMGARGAGHVRLLCELARPTVGIVTRVAAAHTELFGSVDDVASAKGELVEALPPSGLAVLNAADHRVAAMASRTQARVLTFGAGGDVRAESVVLDDDLVPTFTLVGPDGAAEARPAARGLHMVDNALAAAAAGLGLGMTVDEAAAGLAGATLSPSRMALLRLPSGARVLDDAYNANPTSMAAALRALAALPAQRRVAVLGIMAELGPSSDADHAVVGALAGELGIEVVGFGTAGYGGRELPADPAAVAAALGPLGPGDAVLVKGSRVAALERVAAALASS